MLVTTEVPCPLWMVLWNVAVFLELSSSSLGIDRKFLSSAEIKDTLLTGARGRSFESEAFINPKTPPSLREELNSSSKVFTTRGIKVSSSFCRCPWILLSLLDRRMFLLPVELKDRLRLIICFDSSSLRSSICLFASLAKRFCIFFRFFSSLSCSFSAYFSAKSKFEFENNPFLDDLK